jgi:hypothetical protein
MAKIEKGNGMAKFILQRSITVLYPALYPNCTFCAAPKVL